MTFALRIDMRFTYEAIKSSSCVWWIQESRNCSKSGEGIQLWLAPTWVQEIRMPRLSRGDITARHGGPTWKSVLIFNEGAQVRTTPRFQHVRHHES